MDCFFAMYYTVVFIGTFLGKSWSERINHLENRLTMIEGRLDLEAKFRREESYILLTKLKDIERKFGKLQDDFKNIFEKGHVYQTVDVVDNGDDHIFTNHEKRVNDDLKRLFNAFMDEKSINSRIRRYIPEIESVLIKYGASTEKIENYVINASLEFTLVKECLQQILNFAKENKLFSSNIEKSITVLPEKVDKALTTSAYIKASSCIELFYKGHRKTGVYDVYPENRLSPIRVYCDQDTDGGGWTVFQRRTDGSEDFYRGWYDYKFGFGSLEGEFWLGNEYIRSHTATSVHELRIDMEDFKNNRRYAKYSNFRIGAAAEAYIVTVSGYSGDAGDSFSDTSNHKFSTKDRDHDTYGEQCAHDFKGGWWYGDCHYSNLNGLYHLGNHSSYADGINWYHWLGYHYSLKRVEMKIRSLL